MKRQGFTLLELLIVVIIIGVLATIAIPQFVRASVSAKTRKADANLGAIYRLEAAAMTAGGAYVDLCNGSGVLTGGGTCGSGGAADVDVAMTVDADNIDNDNDHTTNEDLTLVLTDPDYTYAIAGSIVTATAVTQAGNPTRQIDLDTGAIS